MGDVLGMQFFLELATSVVTSGVGLKQLGHKETARRQKVRCQIFAYQEKRSLPDELHEDLVW